MTTPGNVAEALWLLGSLGATPWLVRHHELVAEAASELLDRLPERTRATVDGRRVLVGAALHDAGKILHPGEMRGPGAMHEGAGEALLREHGVPEPIARCAVTHATWEDPRAEVEDRLVALADKLWKGKREPALEEAVIRELAARTGVEFWAAFPQVDAAFEEVAAKGDHRLRRSRVT